ncbi:related to Fatty acyl-CoA synthetase and RNA processing-associated kinase 1 [Nakaseomyces glabratus]|nr:Serine/Threonine protein kinases active-site signature [Nakaseomyces glabratus]KAJ9573362.1 hypothetical protein LTX96_0000510 [Nakaseomyces glabratus]QNG16814.1 uncharacterized protein GWK60_M02409 [Nakaseomyces glabratus]SCV15039.1 related to Fatty acyl-CoA synthetase and RNA processing-associated kinase 1 [Nakaseomyces glabratus]SLM14047.1 related to Fatty acyl-CoA synthetase and RNA processing-associated kinase 1 [Nakaseomyces glabratus]
MTASKRHTYYGGGSISYERTNNSEHDKTQRPQDHQGPKHRKHVTFGPYVIGATLGEGEFGKVKLAWSKSAYQQCDNTEGNAGNKPMTFKVPKQVAIKLIKRDFITKDPSKETKIYREINALKHLSHPNIVKLEEVLQNSKYIGIVLEYAAGGEFYKFIQRKRRLKENHACRLFSQLISAVHYIHSKGLVHRDLKLENLLLDNEENLIITDFGFVNEFLRQNGMMKTSCGSPCYAAPELVVSNRPYDARKADTWSCGIILFAMLAGYLPWDDDPKNPDGHDISRLYNYILSTPLKFPEYINPVPRDLLRKILVIDPKKRINIRSIEKHPWLESHSTFLSITPDEWDRLSNTKNIYRKSKPQFYPNKRPGSTYSNYSSGSKDNKRDSLIIDSALVSLPVPPKEFQSHILARPSSLVVESRYSPLGKRNGHNRSNSAASAALQAVFDASERESLKSVDSKPRSRSNDHKDIIEGIQPQKHAFVKPSRKVRPTSMQAPGSSYIHHGNFEGLHELMKRDNSTASSHQTSISSEARIFDASPTLIPDVTKSPSSSTGNSPKLLPRKSFTVSKPLLDLKFASADIIKANESTDSLSKRIHDQIYEVEHPRQRRHSYRYSGIISDLIFGTLSEEGEINTFENKDHKSDAEESEMTISESKLDSVSICSQQSNIHRNISKQTSSVSLLRTTSNHSTNNLNVGSRTYGRAELYDKRHLRQIPSNTLNQINAPGNTHRNSAIYSEDDKRKSTAKRVFEFFKRRSMRV